MPSCFLHAFRRFSRGLIVSLLCVACPLKASADTTLTQLNLTVQTVYQVLLGEIAFQQGDFELAFAAWRSLANRSKDPRAFQRAIEIALTARHVGWALPAAREWAKQSPETPAAREALAKLLVSANHLAEAEEIYKTLVHDWPKNPHFRYVRAVLLLQLNKPAEAKTEFQQTLAQPEANLDAAHFFLGQIEEMSGNKKPALQHYRKVKNSPNWLDAQRRMATLLIDMGHSQKALSNLEKALARFPNHPDLLYQTALLSEQLGQLKNMETHLRHLLRLEPNNIHALNALGYSMADHQINLDEAQELVRAALTQKPDDPYIQDSMGWVLFRQGRLDEAHTLLAEAYQQKPDPEIAAHLGEVIWHLNGPEAAWEIWNAAQEISPQNPTLKATLKRFSPPASSTVKQGRNTKKP